MADALKRFYNRIRIFFLSIFTNRIKRIKVIDKKGKEHNVILDQKTEKSCAHNELKQVANLIWKCVDKSVVKNCEEYFILPYKIQLNRDNMFDWLEDIAKHLKVELKDDAEEQADGQSESVDSDR